MLDYRFSWIKNEHPNYSEVPDVIYEEAEKVAAKLKTIYESRFGGKDKGRFLLSRSQLRQLAGMKRLEDTTKDLIVEAAYEAGYVVTDLGDDFAVIDGDVMHRFRKVPERLLK